jgi:mono/diheme cytochrome c family protein
MMRSLMCGLFLCGLTTLAPAQGPDAKTLYQAQCKKCHGVLGTPPKTMKEKYEKIATFDADFIAKRSDDSIVVVLKKGKGEDMKSFKEKMTPEEMAAVAAYVRELATRKK